MKKRILSLVLASAVLCSALTGYIISAETVTKDVVVKQQETLYEWDLTDISTFWSVSGESEPLSKTSGSNSACDFTIDENGAYMLPKAQWVTFWTTGDGNNIDLSDAANTDIVIEYETPVATAVIVKLDMTSGDGDNFQECYNKTRTGKGTIMLNVGSLKSSKFSGKAIDVQNGYISIQLMTTTGGSGAAVTWKSAKVVKYSNKTAQFSADAPVEIIKSYELSNGTAQGSGIASVHTAANPAYSNAGISMNASAQWVGITTVEEQVDVSDPTTRLVVELDNAQSCSIAYKMVETGFSTITSDSVEKELSLNSETGVFEFYLNQMYTVEQLEMISNGKIKFNILLGSTGKGVTIKSFYLAKDNPEGTLAASEFLSYQNVELSTAAGSEPKLPDTVRVTTVSGRRANIAVSWNPPAGYSCNIPGTYIFTAILDAQSLADYSVVYDADKHEAITAIVTIKEALNYFELPVNNSAGWTRSGTDTYGSYIFDANGLSITPSTVLGYTDSDYTVKNVNLDVVEGISYNISVNGASWAIKVRNLTTGDPEISSGDINSNGEGFFDFSNQGWSGIADLQISLFSVGANKSVVYHKVVLEKKPVPKDSYVIDVTDPEGWNTDSGAAAFSGEDAGGKYSFSDNGLSITSYGSYYTINHVVSTVNMDSVKGILYYIDAPNARWEIKIANLSTGEEIQVGPSWDGVLGTALDYLDFSYMNWTGIANLKISVYTVISGSDDTCVYKSMQLLPAKPDPMPELPKEDAITSLTPDLTDYTEWYMNGSKLTAASGSSDENEYNFSNKGFEFKSKIKKDGVFYSFISSSYTNIDLSALRYVYYKTTVPSAERWDVKITNLSRKDQNGANEVVTISGTWEGIAGSDEGYYALPASWIGASDIKIELFAFTSDKYTGKVLFEKLDFLKTKPSSPDSVTIDFSDYKAFTLIGNEIADAPDYKNDFGSYSFSKNGMTMSANRVSGSDGSMMFWCDSDIRIKNIDFGKTDTLEFDVGITLGSWTIQVKNLNTDETVNYAAVVKPADQAWSGISVPKKSFFNFVEAAKTQLGSVWSGNADILIKFQAINHGNGSNVTFRSAKIINGPDSIPTVTSYEFDFSKYEGWEIENEGLVTKPKGVTANKVGTYNFASSGFSLKTERQIVNGDEIFYTKFSYAIDYVDFDKLNAITVDVLADDASWDIALFCSTAESGKNSCSIADGRWNGLSGSVSGTKNFKDMGWTGIGSLTVQIIGLDLSEGKEIFVRSLSLGTGETTIETSGGGTATSAEELEYATIRCPSLESIEQILADKDRFNIVNAIKEKAEISSGVVLSIAIAGAAILLGAAGCAVLIIRKKKKSAAN